MKKLSPEEAAAKVEAFHKGAGAVVEESAPVNKEVDTEPKGVGTDSFVMPAKKVQKVTLAPEATKEK